MGRPERPLDPQAGPVQRFAFDLRRLREQNGRLSYQELAKRAHYAANTLSEAAKGERLPTLEVTRAFVRACGGDQDAWEERWWEVHHQQTREQAGSGPHTAVATGSRIPASAATMTVPPEAGSSGSCPRQTWRVAASVAVVMLVVVSGGVLWRAQRSPAASEPPRLMPLHLLRAVHHDDGLMRIWTVTTDSAQAVQLISTAKYEMKGELGDCYTKQEPGTVPVWHHTYTFKAGGYQQHLYTIETDPRQDQALVWGWTERDPQPVCYVHPAPVPGTKPIYRMREGSVGPTNGAGDGHGHVLTHNQAQYQPYGFVTDQIWYVPLEKDRADTAH